MVAAVPCASLMASIFEFGVRNDRAVTCSIPSCSYFHAVKLDKTCVRSTKNTVSRTSSGGVSTKQFNQDFCASRVTRSSQGKQPIIRRHTLLRGVSKPHIIITQATAAGGSSSSPVKLDAKVFQETVSSLWEMVPTPIRKFPWDKAGVRLVQRFVDLVWTLGKWLAIPILIVSALSEMLYTFSVNKELLIPIGLLAGIVLAGIMKETALEMSEDLQDGGIPWHLVVIGAFFTLTKLPGPYYPDWACVFLPHVANGGLLQTIRFTIDWQKSQSEITSVEKSSARAGLERTKSWWFVLREMLVAIIPKKS